MLYEYDFETREQAIAFAEKLEGVLSAVVAARLSDTYEARAAVEAIAPAPTDAYFAEEVK